MSPTRGFTLIELTISVTVGLVLIAGVLTIATDATKFSSHVDDHSIVRYEANRAFTRIAEVVRQTGWNSSAGNAYPRINAARDELQFRVLEDLDGNGHPFDQTTGDLEWAAEIYTVRRDADSRTLFIYDAASNPVWTLGRHIDQLEFTSYLQDNSIYLQEIRLRVVANRVDQLGATVEHTAEGSLQMRN